MYVVRGCGCASYWAFSLSQMSPQKFVGPPVGSPHHLHFIQGYLGVDLVLRHPRFVNRMTYFEVPQRTHSNPPAHNLSLRQRCRCFFMLALLRDHAADDSSHARRGTSPESRSQGKAISALSPSSATTTRTSRRPVGDAGASSAPPQAARRGKRPGTSLLSCCAELGFGAYLAFTILPAKSIAILTNAPILLVPMP